MSDADIPFWNSEEGLLERIGLLGDQIQLGTYNNAIKVFATAVGATDFTIAGELSVTSCAWCQMHVGQVYHRGQFMPDLPKHPNCLLPSSKVRTERGLKSIESIRIGDKVLTHRGRFRSVTKLHKNMYRGKTYRLGNAVITSEHPLLTKQGWIRADSVDNVADVLRGEVNNDFEPLLKRLNLKTNKQPSSRSEQNLLSGILKPFSGGIMPSSSIDFDSDFAFGDSKVNIVNIDGILRDDKDCISIEGFKETLFKRGESRRGLNGLSMQNLFGMRLFPSSRRNVSCVNGSQSLFRGLSGPNNFIGFGSGTQWNSCIYKSERNHGLGDAELFSDFPLIHSRLIHLDNFVHGDVLSRNHKLITTERNNEDTYQGFVYNISVQEDDTFCVGAENFISHNCPHTYDVERIGAATPEQAFAEFWGLLS